MLFYVHLKPLELLKDAGTVNAERDFSLFKVGV